MRESFDEWAPPTGSPTGTSGWYVASDGQWYTTVTPPAPGYWLSREGRWQAPDGSAEVWRGSRWGLGDVWLGVLAYVLAGIVGVVAAVLVGDGSSDDPGPLALSAFVALNAVAIFAVVTMATRRKGAGSLGIDFGLSVRRWDPLIGLGLGVAGLLVAGIASFAIDSAFAADEPTSNLPVDDLSSFGDFALFFVAVAIVTPVVEEVFFRGLLYRSLLKRGRSVARSIIATTMFFVIPHLPAVETWPEVASLFASIGVLGLTFNLACHWTGNRLAAPIVAHFVVNGLASVALYLS